MYIYLAQVDLGTNDSNELFNKDITASITAELTAKTINDILNKKLITNITVVTYDEFTQFTIMSNTELSDEQIDVITKEVQSIKTTDWPDFYKNFDIWFDEVVDN